MKDRLRRLREALAGQGLDGLFISHPENRRYLSGFSGSAGYLLITQDRAVLATDFRYVEQAGSQSPDFEGFRIQGELPQWLPGLLAELKSARLGFEADHLSVAGHQQMLDCFKKMATSPRLIPTQGIASGLRATKEPAEVETIQRAVALSDAAFQHICGRLRPGMKEIEVAWGLEEYMRERGSEAMPFDVIVASGPNASMPHHHPGDRVIQEREMVLMDLGARVDGYASDLTRTVFLGQPDDKFRRVYDAVLGAQLTAIATLKAGMTGHEGDRLARTVLEEAGYGQEFGHGLGHGLGLEVHEEPRVGPGSTAVLGEGMVFTVEPGVYLPGWGGVRIEDVVVLEKGGARSLTGASKEYIQAVY